MAIKAAEIEILKQPLSKEDFFNDYVQKRQPVKFSFMFDEFKAMAKNWRNNDYLISKAGDEIITAEHRQSTNDDFGIKNGKEMKFKSFLNLLNGDKENENYYLTVQNIEENNFGPIKLFTSPLNKELMRDIPIKPSILNYLELYQINCWIGNSSNGSSSKLHHDYHDNLYLVIRGQKTFELFPPNCYSSLYVNGDKQLHKIFENGLIAYNDDFREDGANIISVKEWNMINNHNEDGFEEDADDDLLDQLLNAKLNENDSFHDDFDDVFDDEIVTEPPQKRQKLDDTNNNNDAKEEKEDEDEDEDEDPLNFSHINLKSDDDVIFNKFPKYRDIHKLKKRIVVNEGEMFYLPAGWFHNVTSISNKQLSSHFALNYWFHPPIKKDSTIDKPYCDSFWKEYNDATFDL